MHQVMENFMQDYVNFLALEVTKYRAKILLLLLQLWLWQERNTHTSKTLPKPESIHHPLLLTAALRQSASPCSLGRLPRFPLWERSGVRMGHFPLSSQRRGLLFLPPDAHARPLLSGPVAAGNRECSHQFRCVSSKRASSVPPASPQARGTNRCRSVHLCSMSCGLRARTQPTAPACVSSYASLSVSFFCH